eukprot:gene19508-6715_t
MTQCSQPTQTMAAAVADDTFSLGQDKETLCKNLMARTPIEQQVTLAPFIQTYVDALVEPTGCSIKNIQASRRGDTLAGKNTNIGDRFVLRVPFCQDLLQWEIAFQANMPEWPPDFILLDCVNGTVSDTDWVDLSKIPSLLSWESKDPKCLERVVIELLDQYR